jgi:hypothetical protein
VFQRFAILGCCVLAALAAAVPTRGAGHPLETAVMDPDTFSLQNSGIAFERSRSAGARAVRLILNWHGVAPAGSERPPKFEPTNAGDPAYKWASFDSQVTLAVTYGLEPIVDIVSAPAWAEGPGPGPSGTVRPSPAELAHFATAAAVRYGGGFEGLPRVRYWQVWNEPNLLFYLNPQHDGGRPVSPQWYRIMVNAFADAVHAVHRDNVVVAGGLAPFTSKIGRRSEWGVGPLAFMRAMLCMSKALKPTCRERAQFDIWSHHPYTSGGPARRAFLPDDVSLGDLPGMHRLLEAAVRSGHVISKQRVRFWVTEFSWDSNPPDPGGVPSQLLGRWVAEALYRMWNSGVSLVTWFTLRDQPFSQGPYQSGLYRWRGPKLENDRPKPALTAFRFPFVAFRNGNRVFTWGRTPAGKPARVVVEQASRGEWKRLVQVRTDRYGIFSRVVRTASAGRLRSRMGRDASLPFSLSRPRDFFVAPFGSR